MSAILPLVSSSDSRRSASSLENEYQSRRAETTGKGHCNRAFTRSSNGSEDYRECAHHHPRQQQLDHKNKRVLPHLLEFLRHRDTYRSAALALLRISDSTTVPSGTVTPTSTMESLIWHRAPTRASSRMTDLSTLDLIPITALSEMYA